MLQKSVKTYVRGRMQYYSNFLDNAKALRILLHSSNGMYFFLSANALNFHESSCMVKQFERRGTAFKGNCTYNFHELLMVEL